MIKKHLRQKTLSSKENYNHLFQRSSLTTTPLKLSVWLQQKFESPSSDLLQMDKEKPSQL